MIVGASASQYVVQIVTGLGSAAVLFLISSGLTLTFGALRIVNFAHGSLYMLGAYLAVSLREPIGFSNGTFWIVLILAGLGVALAGVVLEVFFFRPIYRRPLLTQLLVTFSFVLILAGIVRSIWGAEGESTSVPPFLGGGVKIAGGSIPTYQFFFMGLSVAVAVGLYLFLYRTGIGRMVRAAVSDPELLGLSGVNVRILFTGVFAVGAFLAGLAGAAVTMQGLSGPDIAVRAVILAFVVIVIGGLGSLIGAFVASILVGLAQDLGIIWVPEATLAIVFVVLVVVLAIRPQGLFGSRVA
ncbi:MAG: branched-chain amino acid ABC transporter permease [Thermoleophilia bacterium]